MTKLKHETSIPFRFRILFKKTLFCLQVKERLETAACSEAPEKEDGPPSSVHVLNIATNGNCRPDFRSAWMELRFLFVTTLWFKWHRAGVMECMWCPTAHASFKDWLGTDVCMGSLTRCSENNHRGLKEHGTCWWNNWLPVESTFMSKAFWTDCTKQNHLEVTFR